ncbi:hypothetical protein HZA99_03800 [Candidatus Woesearchaeota archaeon]|nr:hypothetical protein [Candidatus Woesearchaeota archaeon]
MDEFRRALREIYTVRVVAQLFIVLIEGLFVFLVIYLFLSVINLYRQLTIIPALIFIAYRAWKVISRKDLREVEREHPELAERLRTAADTMHHDNFIVMKLRLSIIKTLRSMKVSSFFNFKELMKQLGYITLVSFIIILVGVYNIQIIDMEAMIQNGILTSLKEKLLKGHIADSLLGSSMDNLNDDFSINNLNNVNALRLQIPQESLATDLPDDIFGGKSFEESLSKKKRIYIRNYFSKVRNYD